MPRWPPDAHSARCGTAIGQWPNAFCFPAGQAGPPELHKPESPLSSIIKRKAGFLPAFSFSLLFLGIYNYKIIIFINTHYGSPILPPILSAASIASIRLAIASKAAYLPSRARILRSATTV